MLTSSGVPITDRSLRIILSRTRKENQGKFVIFAVEKDNKYYMVNEKFKTISDMMFRVREYTRSEYRCYYTMGKKK